MQVFVHSQSTHLVDVEADATVESLKEYLQESENIPIEAIVLQFNGVTLRDDAAKLPCLDCKAPLVFRASLRCGLLGGKGGFGAVLRSLAKQKGKKQTTDFGACRDLSGRRLRHVNDEVLLQKWKEAKEKGEDFDPEEDTVSGINLWYMSTPSWADGIKVDGRKRFMKPRLKTAMCIDWLRARENRLPPAGAPASWGCPRGRRCEFAHGEDELRGEAKVTLEREHQERKREDLDRKKDSYFAPIQKAAKSDNDVMELIKAGMQAAKKLKRDELQDIEIASEVVLHDSSNATLPSKPTDSIDSAIPTFPIQLHSMCGIAEVKEDGSILSKSEFTTVGAPQYRTKRGLNYYYEVELVSDGLIQIGWATDGYQGSIESGDGVGDDNCSWAYDGLRGSKWHNGLNNPYGPRDGNDGWQAGDVIGCYLEWIESGRNISLFYSVNGIVYDPAHIIEAKALTGLFPALSLEKSEACIANIGQLPWKYPPSTALPSSGVVEKESSTSSNGARKHKREELETVDPDKGCDYCNIADNCTVVSFDINRFTKISALPKESISQGIILDVNVAEREIPPEEFKPLKIEDTITYPDSKALERLGAAYLKWELERRGLKVGGTLTERAQRLFSVRGLKYEEINKRLKSR